MADSSRLVTTILFFISIRGVLGQNNSRDWDHDWDSGWDSGWDYDWDYDWAYEPPWGLIIGLSVGGLVLSIGLIALCCLCPTCIIYKCMNNSKNTSNHRPGTVVTAITPQSVYPGGSMMQQPVMYPSGTVYIQGGHIRHVTSPGAVFVPGNTYGPLPYPQGAVLTHQGQQQNPQESINATQGQQQYQGAIITPQGIQQYPSGVVITPQGQQQYSQVTNVISQGFQPYAQELVVMPQGPPPYSESNNTQQKPQ